MIHCHDNKYIFPFIETHFVHFFSNYTLLHHHRHHHHRHHHQQQQQQKHQLNSSVSDSCSESRFELQIRIVLYFVLYTCTDQKCFLNNKLFARLKKSQTVDFINLKLTLQYTEIEIEKQYLSCSFQETAQMFLYFEYIVGIFLLSRCTFFW